MMERSHRFWAEASAEQLPDKCPTRPGVVAFTPKLPEGDVRGSAELGDNRWNATLVCDSLKLQRLSLQLGRASRLQSCLYLHCPIVTVDIVDFQRDRALVLCESSRMAKSQTISRLRFASLFTHIQHPTRMT